MRRTLQDALRDDGLSGEETGPAPCCGCPHPAFALVELAEWESVALSEGRPEPVIWACGVCLSSLTVGAITVPTSDPVDPWGDNEPANGVRAERAVKLTGCDWTQVPDSPLDETARSSWAAYRQALRDLTDTYATPEEVIWPEPPAA